MLLSVGHLGEVSNQIRSLRVPITLELLEWAMVTLLNACKDNGIYAANASPFIPDWGKRR
jgi:hypothetical protein